MTQEQFTTELRYIRNVSERTLELYMYAFRAFEGATDSKAAVIKRVGELREKNISPVSVNTYLRCLNAYFNWLHKEHAKERIRIPKLKEGVKLIAAFDAAQVKRLVSWKPERHSDKRLHVVVLTALDTGMRAEELVSLARSDVNFDNFTLQVKGKGNKQRLVPMSLELRKVLFRHTARHQHPLVFCTMQGCKLSKRNLLRDFKELCGTLSIDGVRCSLHTLRHTFAVNYLRAGGNVFYLQRILGHSSLEMTNRYVRSLGIEDLKGVHNALSLLSR